MARRRVWSSLSPTYQARLKRAGITKRQYESGAALSAARGHAKTPEHPREAARKPERYPEYVEKAKRLQGEANQKRTQTAERLKEIIANRKEILWGANHKYNPLRARENIFRKVQSPDGIQQVPGVRVLKMLAEASDDEWLDNILTAADAAKAGISDDWNALFYH